MNRLVDVAQAAAEIVLQRQRIPRDRAFLVGISGIDGSGKGFIANQLAQILNVQGTNAAIINTDGWLNLPERRFSRAAPAQHFFEHAIRFGDMFSEVVLPLKNKRSVDCIVDFAEETARQFRKERYKIADTDVILLEGIYLFKKQFADLYDLRIWIQCSFSTALDRAICRSQESLSREDTIKAYREIYFPAQRIHFEKDDPENAADFLINND